MYRINTGLIRVSLFLFLALLIGGSSLAQQRSKAELENEKRENLRKIAEAEKILSETKSQKKVTVGQLTALNQQINVRESLISALNSEIELLDEEIVELSIVVEALQTDLKNLKEEYAAMIYSTYKVNHGFSVLTFLFSSSTFNELFMRLKYLEQYTDARRLQAEQIVAVTQELDQQRIEVEIKREEQRVLLSQQVKENEKLINLKNEKNSLIAQLNKREKQLRTEMTDRKKANDKLDRLIAEIIRKEIERNKTMSTTALADEVELTNRFEMNRNKLPWPVNSGFISQKFGVQPHPVLKGITIENTGVDIQTNGQQEVKTVFAGEVKTKAFIQGQNNVVIIKHGDYYTVYSKLEDVKVSRGQTVNADDVIGTVHTDSEGISEVHFEVWKNTTKLDPEKWLVN